MSCFCLKMNNGKLHAAQKNISRFELKEIEAMTSDFSAEKRIGENEFASVYMGLLPSGKIVAVKHLKPGIVQGDSEFIDLMKNVKRTYHPNLISLLGYCSTQGFQTLVSEFAQNKNLSYHLHASKSGLSWDVRVKIAMGVAHALIYLHSEGITHCHLKPANILLNNDFEAQVADFGYAKLLLPHLYDRKIVSMEYVAPEYGVYGKCTDKSDVYSFGMILIEILSGRLTDETITNEYDGKAAWAKARISVALENADFSGLVDPKLKDEYNKGDVYKMVKTIVGCIKLKPEDRPTMKEVLAILDGEADLSYKLVRSDRSLHMEHAYAYTMKILLESRKRSGRGKKKNLIDKEVDIPRDNSVESY